MVLSTHKEYRNVHGISVVAGLVPATSPWYGIVPTHQRDQHVTQYSLSRLVSRLISRLVAGTRPATTLSPVAHNSMRS